MKMGFSGMSVIPGKSAWNEIVLFFPDTVDLIHCFTEMLILGGSVMLAWGFEDLIRCLLQDLSCSQLIIPLPFVFQGSWPIRSLCAPPLEVAWAARVSWMSETRRQVCAVWRMGSLIGTLGEALGRRYSLPPLPSQPIWLKASWGRSFFKELYIHFSFFNEASEIVEVQIWTRP